MAGYHLDEIPKGVFGESSKILEEVMELIDAEKQECKIMQLLELSDLMGAIKRYLYVHFGSEWKLEDLDKMRMITERAFISGERK